MSASGISSTVPKQTARILLQRGGSQGLPLCCFKIISLCPRHMTLNRHIYSQFAAPISVKTPPIPITKSLSIAFDGTFDVKFGDEFDGTYGAFCTERGLRYEAERLTAKALRPFHGLRLTLRWTLRFSCMGASSATP